MPVITAPSAPTHEAGGNLFTSLASPTRGSTRTSVWTVDIPVGEVPTPHELTDEEVFVVLEGRARVEIDGRTEVARRWDAIVVPPGASFALGNAGDVPLRLICCLPVGGQAVLPGAEPFTPPWAL
jgi:mannose-6-phosphate isomerase-like protein (cupin superfamily)